MADSPPLAPGHRAAPAGRRCADTAALTLALASLVAALGLCTITPDAPAAKKKGPLRLGLMDSKFSARSADTRALWLDRARSAGARTIRQAAIWRAIATAQPTDPTDPGDPAYEWSGLDRGVRDATAHGMRVLIAINRAPDWAEGANRDPQAREGTWRPDPNKLAQFATAVATRYSGSYPDPLRPGATLPRVKYWLVWAEPNLSLHLTPQVKERQGKQRAVSPVHYRKMLNAASKAIEEVASSNRVLAGATAPYGGLPQYFPPLDFWRDLLCLRGEKLKRAKRCPGGRARFDVLAHDPLSAFAVKGPWAKASSYAGPGDVVVRDMSELERLLRAARKRRTIRPRRVAQMWVTELSWGTSPESLAVSPGRQASWLADALFLLWRQGVREVMWVQIVDNPAAILQSGLYYEDGTAKPSLTAYRFPFVALRKKGTTKVWGRSPTGGRVTIQRASGKTVTRLKTGKSNVFTGKVRTGGRLQAVASNGDASLVRRPR